MGKFYSASQNAVSHSSSTISKFLSDVFLCNHDGASVFFVCLFFFVFSRKSKPGDVMDESKSKRRPEVGIRIHVPDYKKATNHL